MGGSERLERDVLPLGDRNGTEQEASCGAAAASMLAHETERKEVEESECHISDALQKT